MKQKQPIILIVDDDPTVLKAVRRDVRNKYKQDYRIMATSSANEALETIQALKKERQVIALFLSDQRMPEMLGVDLLAKAKIYYPYAKRVLLTAYSDTDAAIKAINDVQLDYYLTKPWDPPEEKLYPVLTDLLKDWEATYVPEFEGIRVLGYQWSPKSHTVKDYLTGNLIPYQWLDIQTDPRAKEILGTHDLNEQDVPLVVLEKGEVLPNPTLQEIATKLGKSTTAAQEFYDVAIIGAGPAGLAAAVYGASEGLKTLLIERRAPGGQAGTSSRIENYLGFPAGLSGAELTRRAISQAERFGTEFLSPAEVQNVHIQDQYKVIELSTGQKIYAKALVVTTGVDYRKLEAPGISNFTGAGIYYGAATTEAYACKGTDVYIVGGGNSAGQGAMYLSRYAKNVYIVIRRADLSSSMSQYLIDQIGQTENIHLLPHTEISEVKGQEKLECVSLRNRETGDERLADARALFIFIGAKPYTDWIELDIMRDEKGYILTGRDVQNQEDFSRMWKYKRDPYLLETCIPGIFAAGDVRSGAMNRVASAVGEGAMSISMVHKYLAEV
ncbi:MAG: FAD-dependent oxidoreductase [Bacteroidota bacterium]